MRTKNISKKDIIYVFILLAITLSTGVYLVSTTVLIAKDGVTFINYARNLAFDPIKTMMSEYQHPGYPFLILMAHQIAKITNNSLALWSWIYSAQVVTLIFRLLAAVVLYVIGRKILEPTDSFLAILILILLPNPAKYGSDALSDWPYLFFLAGGFLFLMYGLKDNKWWWFGFAGLTAGLGYLIRPECAQLVIFGALWLVLQPFRAKHITISKAVFALVLLLAGFLAPAGPYMKLKGAIFPKKHVGQFVRYISDTEKSDGSKQVYADSVQRPGFTPVSVAKAFTKLFEETGNLLMWFFVPALLLGSYKFFRHRDWLEPKRFLVAALIDFNIPLLVWLYCQHGYISGRHVLSLVIFTIFFVPAGLQVLGDWLRAIFSKSRFAGCRDSQLWFYILLIAGLVLCTPKLLTPIRSDKCSYRQAADWLAKNTKQQDLLAVPDNRINFYAQRQGLEYKNGQIPDKTQYAVVIFKDSDSSIIQGHLGKEECRYVDKRTEKIALAIYKTATEREPSGEEKLPVSDIDNGDNRLPD